MSVTLGMILEARERLKGVAQRTVDFISSIIWICLSVLPGPMGTAIAPSFSAPSWKPMPAVHRPVQGAVRRAHAGVPQD